MTPDVNVVVMNFPNTQKEMVVQNEDGSYTILINAKLSDAGQLKAYNHAMKHIEEDDFQKADVQSIEAAAHEVVIPEGTERIPANKYIDRINRIRKRRKQIQRQIKKDQERINFLMQHFDLFDLAEHQKLYGDDL